MVTVERGRARCPRCMSFAEYQFLDRGNDTLEYQVQCGTCGNVHSEISVVSTPTTAAA
jgi:uncharacterized Zn finger protein